MADYPDPENFPHLLLPSDIHDAKYINRDFGSLVVDYPDPENFLDLLLHPDAHDAKYINRGFDSLVVGRQGFEPWTPGLKVRCSDQLS